MTLLGFDGYGTYNSNAHMARVPEYASTNTNGINTTAGRRAGRCMKLDSTFNYHHIDLQNTISDNTTFVLGVAVYRNHTSAWNYSLGSPFIGFEDGSGNRHLGLYAKASFRSFEIRNGAGSVLGTGTWVLPYQTWSFIELKAYIHDTAGTVKLIINGETTDIDLTAQDTKNGSNGYVGRVVMYPPHLSNAMLYDDTYWLNGQGAIKNDVLGDVRVDLCLVNAAGTHSDFTPSAGSNYQNVDETTPDDDTTYNYSSTVSNKDSYNIEPLEVLGTTIHGVKTQITMRKDDVGTKKAKVLRRLNSSDYLGDEETLADAYKTFIKVDEVNPDDSAAFEEADIAGMEPGGQITV